LELEAECAGKKRIVVLSKPNEWTVLSISRSLADLKLNKQTKERL